jgi:hypothetical protein
VSLFQRERLCLLRGSGELEESEEGDLFYIELYMMFHIGYDLLLGQTSKLPVVMRP